jgi:carbon starvation protein
MNGLYLVIISALVFVLAYRFYGAFIAAKVLTVNQYKVTPAFRFEDGHDYVPTNKYVVFGHHFAAIAGAGPLVGPVIAAQFGYLPGALWILIGGVLAGAVHDMVILFCSMRYDGKSIAEIAKAQIGDKTGLATSFAVLFLNILAMAGMAVVIVNALHDSPWGTFTIGMTIPIAIFIGIYMQFLRPGRIKEGTSHRRRPDLAGRRPRPGRPGIAYLGSALYHQRQRHFHRPHHLRLRSRCPSGMAAPGTA